MTILDPLRIVPGYDLQSGGLRTKLLAVAGGAMAAISSISNTNLTAIRQAQANVASADDYARSLQSLSREAERALNQAQARADSIAAESDQAQAEAVRARQRLAAIGGIGGFIDTMA